MTAAACATGSEPRLEPVASQSSDHDERLYTARNATGRAAGAADRVNVVSVSGVGTGVGKMGTAGGVSVGVSVTWVRAGMETYTGTAVGSGEARADMLAAREALGLRQRMEPR